MADLEITSNLSGTHLDALRKLIVSPAERILIVSPFLASDVEALLSEFDFSQVKRVDLVTTIKPSDPEQLTKPFQIRQFMDHFTRNYVNIVLKVHVDNSLHGKIYISQSKSGSSMIVSSANFTRSGLLENHEWGVRSTSAETIETVLAEVLGALEYEDVSYHQISKACQFAQVYAGNHPEWTKAPTVTSDILDAVYSAEDSDNKNPQYFLKPIGTSDEPILLDERWDFSELHQNLYFSKKKPRGVRKGDIVITTAIGPGSLLSYFKVTGGLSHVTKEELARSPRLERWPWYMEGKCQSPKFGRDWWRHNIRRQDVLEEFLEVHPGIPVTESGSFSLGTLNFGNDKVQLTEEFAKFIIDKIEQIESA